MVLTYHIPHNIWQTSSAPSVEQTNKIGPVKEGNTVANVGDMLDKEHDDDDTVGSDLSDLEELEQ